MQSRTCLDAYFENEAVPCWQEGVLRGISIQLGVMDGCKAGQGANIFTDMAFESGQGILQLQDRHFYVSSAAGSVCQVLLHINLPGLYAQSHRCPASLPAPLAHQPAWCLVINPSAAGSVCQVSFVHQPTWSLEIISSLAG